MHWVKFCATTLLLWNGSAWGATLSWNANTDLDLAGYYVYQCSQLPCGKSYGTATLLTTLGKVTTFNIGTPSGTQYYVITAYDFGGNESPESNVATYVPTGSVPPVVPPEPPPAVPPPPTVPPPSIGLTPTNLNFTAVQGGGNPPTQTVNVANTGGGTLTWSASENSAWLTMTPTTGTGSGTIRVTVTTGSRAAGTYTAAITVSAAGASPVIIPVSFIVNAAPTAQLPPPIPAGLKVLTVQ
ncbi:MAG: hypothetical protein U0412_07985 [Nitrospira sp.]